MNEYLKTELLGRNKLKLFLISKGVIDIRFTKGDYDRIDCFFTYKDKTVGVEIKNRNPKYEGYDTYIMEKLKLDYMDILLSNGDTDNCWMVYFFGKNMYLFSYRVIKRLIAENKILLLLKLLPNSTVHKTKEISKDTYLLPKKYAKKFTL